jgi:hypothetical protein
MENDERWVDARLETLNPAPGWQPDSAAALRRVRAREPRPSPARRRLIMATAAVSAAGLALLLVPLHQKCAAAGCTDRSAALWSFKESGAITAPVTCELYLDYQCQPCARFYVETLPRLMEEYVRTGKVRLVHRDLPMASHAYARMAARYANAAGRVGQYQVAVDQLFRTQSEWSVTGDVDGALAGVLSAASMARVRDLVADSRLDETTAADAAMARVDGINRTPSLVVVSKGRREVIAGIPDFSALKKYLDRVE